MFFQFSSDSISFFQFILSFHQIEGRYSRIFADECQIFTVKDRLVSDNNRKTDEKWGRRGRGWIKVGEDDIPNGFHQLHKTLYRVHLFNNYSTILYEENLLRLKEQASVGSKTRSGVETAFFNMDIEWKHRVICSGML